jgi:phospholipid/cholesterol/gamma-HCH transport system permease protein
LSAAAGWIEHVVEGGEDVLYLEGAWRLANLKAIVSALRSLGLHSSRFVLDGSRLESLDTAAGFTLYTYLVRLGCTEATVRPRGFDPRHGGIMRLVHERMKCPAVAARSVHLGLVERIGAGAIRIWQLLGSHTGFVGALAMDLLELVFKPRRFRARETVSQFEAVGLDAIPIVALVTFLIGVVFAYLLGQQALRYGANIFVVDGVGIAMCRELSPLLASIIVAGRSGAAFTAQIGTMKVQEEIDAIATLGLSPIQVLVIPRLVAIAVALPFLVFIGDVCGIAGGMLVTGWLLDVPPQAFMDRLHDVLPLSALVVGLVKAPVFAVFIAAIACRMGLLVARDARSVGLNTTSTVVQSVVSVIVLDAIFAVVFQRLHV